MTTMTQAHAGALLATANINESGNDTVTEIMTDLAEAVPKKFKLKDLRAFEKKIIAIEALSLPLQLRIAQAMHNIYEMNSPDYPVSFDVPEKLSYPRELLARFRSQRSSHHELDMNELPDNYMFKAKLVALQDLLAMPISRLKTASVKLFQIPIRGIVRKGTSLILNVDAHKELLSSQQALGCMVTELLLTKKLTSLIVAFGDDENDYVPNKANRDKLGFGIGAMHFTKNGDNLEVTDEALYIGYPDSFPLRDYADFMEIRAALVGLCSRS